LLRLETTAYHHGEVPQDCGKARKWPENNAARTVLNDSDHVKFGNPDLPFEASCGDARPDGSCPVFIARHGRDVVTAEVIVDGPLLRASYTTTDRTLDDDDILRVFVLAYLERFTCHFYQATVKTIELHNSTTGAMRSTTYPDRAWLEPEWNS
jgi:hypothetical protein